MAISEQFAGLDMRNLISGPLTAAADASVQLAQSTSSFINDVGFDEKGNTRTTHFKFNQNSKNEDGTTSKEEMDVEIPLLAIVPIPNLQIDEVNVLFDMEVKQSEKSESSTDISASASVSAGFWGVKVNISGSVATHSQNTRSSDNSAKYHVDVSATNHGTPEGLARVLDMMAANVAPTLVNSKSLDDNGKELIGDKKEKNDKLKALKAQKENLSRDVKAAEGIYNADLEKYKKLARNQQNYYIATLQTLSVNTTDDEKLKKYANSADKINMVWQDLYKTADTIVKLAITKKEKLSNDDAKITDLKKLLKIVETASDGKEVGDIDIYLESDNTALTAAYNNAINAMINCNAKNDSFVNKQKEIDSILISNN